MTDLKTTPLTGILPVAPTPFFEDGSLDLQGMKNTLDCLIDQGVDAICILANYSEQFVLSDEERRVLTWDKPLKTHHRQFVHEIHQAHQRIDEYGLPPQLNTHLLLADHLRLYGLFSCL